MTRRKAAVAVHHAGDPLGRSYTPDACALAIVTRLRPLLLRNRKWSACAPPLTVLEPCVGGGAFVRAVRARFADAVCHGYDLDENAAGLADCNDGVVSDASARMPRCSYDLSITNPPFGKAVGQDVTLAIVRSARQAATVCAMLLPLDVVTQSGFEHDIAECVEVWPLLPRPWPHARGMVVLVWQAGRESETTRFRPLRWKVT